MCDRGEGWGGRNKSYVEPYKLQLGLSKHNRQGYSRLFLGYLESDYGLPIRKWTHPSFLCVWHGLYGASFSSVCLLAASTFCRRGDGSAS